MKKLLIILGCLLFAHPAQAGSSYSFAPTECSTRACVLNATTSATTQARGDNSTKIATTAYVDTNAKYKVITFTYDVSTASGTQAVTGVGFKPKIVLFTAAIDSTFFGTYFGADDGVAGVNGVMNASEIVAGKMYTISSSIAGASIEFLQTGANYVGGNITTFGADGFTLTWTKTGSPTGTANIVAVCIG